jgi:hypothetical protein
MYFKGFAFDGVERGKAPRIASPPLDCGIQRLRLT